jgi:hypothetical protein
MYENHGATLDTVLIGTYLGFEIRYDVLGTHIAEPTFRSSNPTSLEAGSLPALRKRIWQWWHQFEALGHAMN